MANCDICEIIPEIKPEHIIIDGEHWVANLREQDQTLLGSTFITARRHVPELDYLTPEEDEEFTLIRNALFKATRRAFQPSTFNISCLKNLAFADDPDSTPDDATHVHWHVKPRYGTEPISFAGEDFTDPMPGAYLTTFERHVPQPGTAIAIAEAIREHV